MITNEEAFDDWWAFYKPLEGIPGDWTGPTLKDAFAAGRRSVLLAWQLIQDAPKDGTWLLLCNDRTGDQYVGRCNLKIRWERDRFASDEDTEVNRKRVEIEWDIGGGLICHPTHYMPLIPPPET